MHFFTISENKQNDFKGKNADYLRPFHLNIRNIAQLKRTTDLRMLKFSNDYYALIMQRFLIEFYILIIGLFVK